MIEQQKREVFFTFTYYIFLCRLSAHYNHRRRRLQVECVVDNFHHATLKLRKINLISAYPSLLGANQRRMEIGTCRLISSRFFFFSALKWKWVWVWDSQDGNYILMSTRKFTVVCTRNVWTSTRLVAHEAPTENKIKISFLLPLLGAVWAECKNFTLITTTKCSVANSNSEQSVGLVVVVVCTLF